MNESLVRRFHEKVEYIPGLACHLWIGSYTRHGYGQIWNGISASPGYRMLKAHRVSWEIANKSAVPDGLFVLHKCDNPPCVNPAHLFIGTAADNIRDAYAKGRLDAALKRSHEGSRRTRNRKTHCNRGHDLSVPENTWYYRGYRRCAECERTRYQRSKANA